MKLGMLLKTKLLAIILASVAVTGGAAAAAATPAGQHALQALTGQADATATVTPPGQHDQPTPGKTCTGEPEAKNLAAQFSLSTDTTSDALQAICALHAGTFTGTTPDNQSVTTKSRVYGYGEIEMLLTYAHYQATHDPNNPSGKLTTDNARSYLAEALQSCGTAPLESCLQQHIPGYQPGTGNGTTTGSGNGKPQTTPTPPSHPDPTPHH